MTGNDRSVRVLAMVHAYPPHYNAGAEWMLHTMLRVLVEHGHRVEVLLSQHHGIGAPYELHGVTVHPRQGKGDPFRWLSGDRGPVADVIVTHLENTPRATVLGRRSGVPVIQVLHNEYRFNLVWCGQAALVVANARWIAEATGLPSPMVVRPPVLAADYATTPGDHVTLINLSSNKGAHVFYQMADRFPRRRFLGVLGAYERQIVRELPNVEIVEHMPGEQMRERVYARTRVLLMPSSYESYGRTAVEAMCSGIPVVAHPTPGLKESLGPAGIYADRDDPDAWATALRRLSVTRTYQEASRRAASRAAELDPGPDLDRWRAAVESLARK